MNDLVRKRTKKFIRRKTRVKRWMSVVTALACVVVFCTTYALILPAITMEREAFCGNDEHMHTEDCYAPVKACFYGTDADEIGASVLICGLNEGDMPAEALICGLEEYVHEHTDDCYEITTELSCAQEEHTHSEACYEVRPVLTCTETEHTHGEGCYELRTVLSCAEQEHTHGDACYDDNGDLICTLAEHTHSDECYTEESVFVCTLAEHTHSDECYTEEPVLVCTLAEHTHGDDCLTTVKTLICTETGHTHDASCYAEGTVGHVHTEACYHTHTDACFTNQLVCEVPVHEHTLQCYSNPALTESEDYWVKSMSGAELTGVWADDLVAIARTQLGYKESEDNYLVASDGVSVNGYTRYGDWAGNKYAEWNTLFTAFCLAYTGISPEDIPCAANTSEWVATLLMTNQFAEADTLPVPGDLIFFDYNEDGTADSVGIVTEAGEEKISVIMGDVNGEVTETAYSLTNTTILGYGKLPEAPVIVPPVVATTIETTTEDGVTVTVSGNLPEGAAIRLSEVPAETLAEIMAQIGEGTPFFAYDITVIDEEGTEWQPDELGARVTITGLSIPSGLVDIAHVADGGEIETLDADASDDGVEFEAPGFSIYIGYTVDFNYDGVCYSIPGGTEILLSEIFAQLGIPVPMDEIAEVVFSNPELIRVDACENDWLLVSLAPFDTEESLVITHTDGSVRTIVVLDDQTDPVETENDTTVNVSVTWLSAPPSGSSITATLYKNGVSTGRTLTLSSSNSWRGSFTDLEAGTYFVEYTTLDNYVLSSSSKTTVTGGWTSVSSLERGKTYVFVRSYNNNRNALTNSSGSTLSNTSVTISNGTITSTVTNAMQWIYSGTSLQNKATERYLRLSRNYTDTNDTAAGTTSFSGGKLSRTYNGTTRYLRYANGNYTNTTTQSDGATFTAYVQTASETTLDFSLTGEMLELIDKAPDHRKYIDAFRDNKDNPDTDLDDKARAGELTDDIFDLYRLYLDVGPESTHNALDVFFILDSSTSMGNANSTNTNPGGYDAVDILGNTAWRYWGLDTLVNGEPEDVYVPVFSDRNNWTGNNYIHQTTLADNGLIRKLALLNPSNEIAVARFSATSEVLMGWTEAGNATAISISNASGTNYVAGLQEALAFLEEVKSNGNAKIMIFISDGLPTRYFDSLYSEPTSNPAGRTEGETEINATAAVITEFKNDPTVSALINADMLDIYTISVGTWETYLLDQLSTTGSTFSSTNFQEIMKHIDSKLTGGTGHYLDMKVVDTLSDYVDFYTDDLDFRIDKITTNDQGIEISKTPLYEDGEMTPFGAAIIKENGISISGKTVIVDFKETYEEEGNTIYRISFNVKTAQTAYNTYERNNGYSGTKGDPGTDYPDNTTSSDKPGFFSNADAYVEYTQVLSGSESITNTAPYDDPVIQVKDDPDLPTPETIFEHNKTIDFLGDGETNPDTTLTGADFYRLYLDMTGKQEPVDLLFIVDASGSMSKTDMTIGEGSNMQTGQRRDTAVTTFLNGTSTSGRNNSDGFLAKFLSLNPENKVAVAKFYGVSADRNDNNVSNSTRSYTQDSSIVLNWTSGTEFTSTTFANCSNENNNGTNYEAGLRRATEMFERSDIQNDGHKKILVFLSDGVPTYFMIDNNDVGTVCNGYTLNTSDVGHRWGTGSYSSVRNYPYCKDPSKQAFDDFMAANPDVMVFTIGVSADISATSQSESQSPEVLQYMADNGGGLFLSVNQSMSELTLKLESIFYPKGVTITDNLSKYVRYYGNQPDVLVTMTNTETGVVTDLYKNGRVTAAGQGILTSVIYTPADSADAPTGSTGTVTASFDRDYQFKPEYTYTLSFNVQATETAYNEFENSGFNATGDPKTDYGTNKTSSRKPGFYSNDSATVTFIVDDSPITEVYVKPVIQVTVPETAKLTVHKTVAGATTTQSFHFELLVKNSDDTLADLSERTLPTGVTLKTKDGVACILAFDLADGGEIVLNKILPKDAKVTLLETAHDGYTVSITVGDLGTFSGDEQSFVLSDDLTVTVVNTAGSRLPETGGSGTYLFTYGGLVMMIAACVYITRIRKRERRYDWSS